MNIFNLGKGYLTYAVGIAGILWGLGGLVFGYMDKNLSIETIMLGLGLLGLRRAIKSE